MRILLIGEYSRLHNSLKEGLEHLGHRVFIAGNGDGFKDYPIDIPLKIKYSRGIMLLVRRIILKLFKEDISSIATKKQFYKLKHLFKDYDIVQLINENAFNCAPKTEIELLKYIFENNKNVYLLSCGNDYTSVSYAYNDHFRYSILTPFFNGKVTDKAFNFSLKYITEPYKNLHHFIFKHITGVVATDLDYHLPLLGNNRYLGMIPNPINTDKLAYKDLKTDDKIIIFHGINNSNYYKKGNDIFEAALNIISEKYAEKITIITVKSLPYKVYIKSFNDAHIVLDQVYAYDQGYNALEAMAKGKVVFTGAEQEWLDYYNLEPDTVAINALPEAEKIAEKLEWLILNPKKLIAISKNARAFVEQYHHYINIAKNYVDAWSSKLK